MPRYFFAIQDGVYIPDELGQELQDDNAARREAQILYDDLKEERRHGAPLHIRVIKENGEEITDGFSPK
jgi:hypothetical protein